MPDLKDRMALIGVITTNQRLLLYRLKGSEYAIYRKRILKDKVPGRIFEPLR